MGTRVFGRRLSAVNMVALVAMFAAPLATSATAQVLPSEPIQLAAGRLVLGGELSASVSSSQDTGYFNLTDYEHDVLRLLRLSLSAALAVSERVTVLGEVRTENGDTLRPYALYVRIRPWLGRALQIQAGRIPPTFGAFTRRQYGYDNPLVGYPLAYQYLTTVRSDALPASADDLLNQRGRGWYVMYPFGGTGRGLPLASVLSWDTGVQVTIGSRPLQISAAVTNGTLSNPKVGDDNGGKQFATRVVLQPSAGLVIGVSGALGPFVSRDALAALPVGAGDEDTQRALGVDVEYSRDHWLVRAEAILNEWRVPSVEVPLIDEPLRALGVSVEGRYRMRPEFYVAGRVDHLGFSRITGTAFNGRPTTWEAPVSRLEVGGGYYLRRNIIGKLAYQYNWRDGGRKRERGFVIAQLLYWF